jgi:hypothetical protein
MSFNTQLRTALAQAKEGKDISREAGQGVWANYVRAVAYGFTVFTVEDLEKQHKVVVEALNDQKELSKEEKNSLRSAKSVVAKAVTNNVDIWQREDHGGIKMEAGQPMPKGKSELSEAKTDYQRMMGFIESATKKYESDTRDSFTREELKAMADAYASLANSMIEELNMQ